MTTTKTEQQAGRQETFQLVVQAIDASEHDPDRHLSVQIDDCIRDAVLAAQTAGESATVTIKVKVEPGVERRVTFTASVKAQLPRPPVPGATLYADRAGGLHQSDPKQTAFDLTNRSTEN